MKPSAFHPSWPPSPADVRAAAVPVLALAMLTAAPEASTAAPTIYRCEQADTIVFSDRPCDDHATPHSPSRSISVVNAPSDLDSIAERNAAYLESQQAERVARARARAAERAARAEAARRTVQIVRTVPIVPAGIYPTRPVQPPPVQGSRIEALRGNGRGGDGRRIPISATSGRQLGSRRPPDDDG